MKRLSRLRVLQAAPDSVAAHELRLGRSPWTNFIHLVWSVWVFLTPALSGGDYGFTPTWFALTAVSYPLFLWLYATSVFASPRRAHLAALAMVALCLGLLRWYPSGLSYFVFGCVMLQPRRSRSLLRYLGQSSRIARLVGFFSVVTIPDGLDIRRVPMGGGDVDTD